jgi:DNA repair protein RecO (recombination protein O)
MSRSFTYSALILRSKPSGESNREIWFLSAEEGILRATVFGGPKSKLRSHVSPFHQGKIWIYHDPVRDSRKITDFDVENWRPGLRELYERALGADALAETILATHAGGGGWDTALALAAKTLDCLENADEKTCSPILLHFFWAWAGFLGVRPDVSRCASCACKVPPDDLLWYDLREGSLFCRNCTQNEARDDSRQITHSFAQNAAFTIGGGARRWLLTAQDQDAGAALKNIPDDISLKQARALVLAILTEALGKRLPLWSEV